MAAERSSVAAELACFVEDLAIDRIPAGVVDKARRCLFYGIGIGLCSFPTRFAQVAAEAAIAGDGDIPGGATILWSGRRGTVGAAALANAALLHGRCQEDTCGTAHLGAVVIPVLLALVETGRADIDRLLPALIAGYETGGALEAALGRRTMAAGLRATPLYGIFAAAAAAAKALDLSAEQMASAFAHAAAFAGGTLQPIAEGTDEWRYQAGTAAQLGLVAADLARAGARGASAALEGAQGFAQAYAGHELGPGAVDGLGSEWALRRVTFKPYPVCAHNQAVVTAALALGAAVEGEAIRRLEVRVNPYIVPGMTAKGPFQRVSETLMSSTFCAAAAIVRGKVDLTELSAFDDALIADLVAKAELVPDPDLPFPACAIRAELADGRRVEHVERATFADYELDRAQIAEQLHRIGSQTGVPDTAVTQLRSFVDALPGGDIADVLSAADLVGRRTREPVRRTRVAPMPA